MKAHLALPTLLAMALGCSRQQTEAPAAPTLQAPTPSMSAGVATPPSPASVAWAPGRGATVALATLHRRVSPPDTVLVEWEDADGSHAETAEALPLPLVI